MLNGAIYSNISCVFWLAVDFSFYGLVSRWHKVSWRLRGRAKNLVQGGDRPYRRFCLYYDLCRDRRSLDRLGRTPPLKEMCDFARRGG